ncbi:uncharacterized protein r2d2 [Drosophila montana]|uniref:uncharacterized protein r2d2 n=1 Tax=Drosophila montana TaxID=40370 RepID=UPI00313C7257
MENKSSVSALQEYCAQAKTGNPVYDYIDGEDGGYVCKVVLMDIEAYGNGRSKRDAKHLAAANIMRKLRKLPGFVNLDADGDGDGQDNFNLNSVADELTNMNRDMLKELRDYCVRHDMPLPIIEIVQQSGSPNAPEFVACCSVASIKRYGKSDKKKDARQRAAIEMLCIISNDSDKASPETQLVSTKTGNTSELESTLEDVEAERRRKFKTYRELTDAGGEDNQSVKLCDRHNYFKSFYPKLKEAAFEVLNSTDHVSSKAKLLDVLGALKLNPRTTALEAKSMEPVLQIELNCDYDCVFIGPESKIYNDMIQYFRVMLV